MDREELEFKIEEIEDKIAELQGRIWDLEIERDELICEFNGLETEEE